MKKRFLNLNRFYILKADGQALLFVIVAMTVALAVGVNVSLRTLSSVSRTAQSDTSERVLAAAEGGAESFIKLSVGQLEAISDAFDTDTVADYLCDDAGDDVSYDPIRKECLINYTGLGLDNVDAKAYVRVDEYPVVTGVNRGYEFRLEQDTLTEVAVVSSTVQFCFSLEGAAGDIIYMFYGSNQLKGRGGFTTGFVQTQPNQIDYSVSGFTFVNSANSPSARGYTYCRNINVPAAAKALRLRAVGGDIKVGVFNPSLPVQGYQVTSTGELVQDGVVQISRQVRVFKSYSYLPGIFDFGIFSNQAGWDYL
ncbi:MAG: hypothetical protein UU77_C0010G0031 [candidate division WWE3 bacterium GW2011_GWC1_41_7]|uniref:Uncharacterized protein n=4 Tax=Katanobacteria TaxID=422282 RepID=A0A0G0XA01_UNCKA|nr:MAG: hypothetical protein UU72_C0010G0022 [candidate division WWE3 bacterium GW2011_GWB1_41_6]KKS21007.1 MAG: hypothetical protein UU77_C0010G0031 [candidate division WWE3 bacterium GW2011_GWC1_41_7]KKS21760.1 MAG: hypothetical protein UU80_C0021G0031 [candidate division WWE3 bacterium GW2011_GWA1_41_8]OGC58034.1 MAG: hypothetical protein A2976_04000 [candidate division WWE3 bacterium RIFCSPLOWO2_01_FULL_41_9]